LGLVARLSDVKGQDILVDAMSEVVKKVSNAKLILFGEGKLERMLRDKVEVLGIGDSVIFDLTINRPAECMSVLDIFVAPSRMEGLGLSIMEAQACGLPVIGSRVGGIPQIIEDNVTGVLVEPQDPKELADAIVKLLNDAELRKTLGANARIYAQDNYSSDEMINKTIEVYEKNISR